MLCIAGSSGSGKTALITALIPLFAARGVRISTIKHAHHAVSFDQPGKDSYLHARAGAAEVILAGETGFALFGAGAPDLAALLARLAPVDLVFLEGFKSVAFPKLEVFRPALRKPPLWPDIAVLAVVSDAALPDCPAPVLDLNKPVEVTDFIFARLGLNGSGD